MQKTKRLHLMQASMQFNDTPAQQRSDFDEILARGADVIGFTEVNANKPIAQLLHTAAHAAGYRVLNSHKGGDPLAVKREHDVLDAGWQPVHPGNPGPAAQGGYAPRGISWAQIDFDGELVFVHEAHWITGFDRRDERAARHTMLSEAMSEIVTQHARGRCLSFFMGDDNIDERVDVGRNPEKPAAIFADAKLLTIWDELDEYPGTHGKRVIDIIGSHERDRRVTAHRVKVWPQLHTDHRQVSAWYDIAPRHA